MYIRKPQNLFLKKTAGVTASYLNVFTLTTLKVNFVKCVRQEFEATCNTMQVLILNWNKEGVGILSIGLKRWEPEYLIAKF